MVNNNIFQLTQSHKIYVCENLLTYKWLYKGRDEILLYLFDTMNTTELGRILLTHSHKRLHRVRIIKDEVKNLLKVQG